MEHTFKIGGEVVTVQVSPAGGSNLVRIGGRELVVDGIERNGDWLSFSLAGRRYSFRGRNTRDSVFVIGADSHAVFQKVRGGAKGVGEEAGSLRAPMTGQVLKVFAKAGDAVEKGQRLMILEAMKMEHEILAPAAGTIAAMHFAEGQKCQQDDTLVEMAAISVE